MRTPGGRLVKTGLLALLATIGFDLLLHAGILAPLYADGGAFLLPPEEAFRRIPFGYLSFALLTALLVWLMEKTGARGWKRGFGFGLAVGALVWGAQTIGLYSISTARPELLLGWFAGQSVEMGVAGAVTGSGLQATGLRPLFLTVIVFFVATAALAVVLQNLAG